MKFKVFTDADKRDMAEAYSSGVGLKDLAKRYEVSIPTMAKYVRAGGGTVRKPGTSFNNSTDFVKTVEAVNAAMQTVDITSVILDEPVTTPVRVLLPID